MQKYFTKLKASIINNYLGRKHQGMLSLFYNTKNRSFIALPKEIEHAVFITGLLNITLDDIKNRVIDVSYFIPVTIIISEDKFASIIVGISSLEMGCNVIHKKQDLMNARNSARVLLGRGPLKIKNGFKEHISTKYAY